MDNNNSNYPVDYDYWKQETTQYEQFRFIVNAYVSGPLILVGLVGNIIAFCMLGKLTHQNAATFLLRGLALSDIFLLLSSVVFLCSYETAYFHVSPTVWTIAVYAVNYSWAILQLFNMVNVWTTVVVGMNRYEALCRPLDVARLCSTGRARKHMTCIVLFSIAYGLPAFFENTIRGVEIIREWYFYLYNIGCNVMFRFLIPFSLLLFFCFRIIIALRASKRQALGRHGGQQADAKITSMLLVLLCVFLVCNVSVWITFIVFFSQNPRTYIRTSYAIPVIGVLYIFNSSANCLIYIIYIKEFRKLLCARCTHCSHQNEDYELA